jgi:hypothetical protein
MRHFQRSSIRTRLVLSCVGGIAWLGIPHGVAAQEAAQAKSEIQIALSSNPFLQNDRLEPDHGNGFFDVPEGTRLIITDIVVQNRSPGDEPVSEFVFSRLSIGPMITDAGTQAGKGSDLHVTAVGNQTVNLHFTTGLESYSRFRVQNAPNSTAPFCEVIVSGYLARNPK